MATSSKTACYTRPTKRQVILCTILWVISAVLFVVGTTSVFTESLLNKKYTVLYIILIGAAVSTARLIRSYARNNR
jgi:hypothetical protein